MIHVTEKDFETEVKKADKPVLVKFFATWCGPCKAMTPVVEELESELGDQVKVVEVDIDESAALAMEYKVAVVPTFLLIKNGEVAAKSAGMMGKEELKELMVK